MKQHEPKAILIELSISLAGLLFLITSSILALFNINVFLVAPFQIIGNILFGIGLIYLFVNLKQNQLLKWTSLVIGVLYCLNLLAINSLVAYIVDNYDIFEIIPKSTYITYLSISESLLIVFGISFIEFRKVKKSIGYLAVIYVILKFLRLFSNLYLVISANVTMLANLEEQTKSLIEVASPYLDLISYISLSMIFLLLIISQKNRMQKSLKVKGPK